NWFLAKVRDAIRMATWTRRMRRFLLNNGAASPSRPCAGKYGKTSKPPRFTNLGQEPFAQGLRQDYAAVKAALTWPYSNGPTEGHVNRLKLLKRQMYGRAKLDLLRQRVLYAA